ncbi:hypothetical protein N7533_010261 [Penicillium manginii]|uniref:uncharacterized protein n=1 Tax=Penicillium manginii TaxID=203109 RepID=UPI002547ED1B|nr:uncharacterized protein N7533_010261 [Penicillium manginii]KAJ5743159.1 hypothetical protein N7533_010261 [Penicillium manginii]
MRQPAPIHWVVQVCLLWLSLLSPFTLVRALATPDELLDTRANVISTTSTTSQADNGKFLLRVLPLGASITFGYKSTDGNGYREWIRRQLRFEGWPVEMVGTRRAGTMRDNFNEGHVGFRIDQMLPKAEKDFAQRPNLILINVGTNDALQNHRIYSAGTRMNILVEKLFDSIEGTTIILSTLLPNGRKPEQVESINEQIRNLVAYRRARNNRIVLADMSHFIKVDELVDRVHPDDAAYEKMASVWWAAFQTAQSEGMLQNFNYTSTMFNMKKLDDNTTDPHLPAYSAPAQPSVESRNNGQPPSVKLNVWILALQAFTVYIGFSTLYT